MLPFDNLSGDPRWSRLADGLSEDIITDLARHREILVSARNSSFAYRGKSADLRQVGRDLGVRYVLEGSLQSEGDRLRVTAQLIDTTTGGHIWADRFDRQASDLFAIQDEISGRVAATVAGWQGDVARQRLDAASRKPPTSLDAYDLYLLGIEQKHLFTKESEAKAAEYLEQAVKLDPGLARAWSGLSLVYVLDATLGLVDDPDAALGKGREAADQALRLDPRDPFAHSMRAGFRASDGDLAGAREDFTQAEAVAPNDADSLAVIA